MKSLHCLHCKFFEECKVKDDNRYPIEFGLKGMCKK